jgi:CHAT domain-containing protein
LALVDPPLDATRPAFLGAQVAMGRWILGDNEVTLPPRHVLSVRAMAVMAGMYKVSTGLRPLPEAIAEASALTQSYSGLPAIPLDCTVGDLKDLLDASVMFNLDRIGGVDAVHFAGHGEVDPTRPWDAAIYLKDGRALTPTFFRRSKLGATHTPFIFLNACMVGSGGQMLGDFGGFPGNCLAGKFAALVAPLWAVNDSVAKSMAIEFYREAFQGPPGRSVAEILRDLRANYESNEPVPTYLAYVYYGSPHLRLMRIDSVQSRTTS